MGIQLKDGGDLTLQEIKKQNEDLFAYSTMLASGQSIEEMDQQLRKEAQRKIPKLDETSGVVEYSSMLADKAEDSDSPEAQ